VKAAVPDPDVTLAEIFSGSIPYWLLLIAIVVTIVAIPQVATFLPAL
jgi:TRAP-type mannitol/chloroaromatic compound transport system permease large subunit